MIKIFFLSRLLTCMWCWWQYTWRKKPETPCRELYRCSPSRPAEAWRSRRSERSPHVPCTSPSSEGSQLPTGVLLGTLSEMRTLFGRVLHPGLMGFLRDCRTLNLSVWSIKNPSDIYSENKKSHKESGCARRFCCFRLQTVKLCFLYFILFYSPDLSEEQHFWLAFRAQSIQELWDKSALWGGWSSLTRSPAAQTADSFSSSRRWLRVISLNRFFETNHDAAQLVNNTNF